MRDQFHADLKTAMKAKDQRRASTLRLIMAAVKDRDIAARAEDKADGVDDAEILAILQKMVKQRDEAASTYEDAGRVELAEQEREELAIIKEYLPKPLSDEEADAAVAKVVAELGAASLKDMGRTMAALKEQYAGQLDMKSLSGKVKAALGG
ncbi:MAG: GatB/YqeY domain-containing protein [Alphaproteobacteria bacterium]